MVLNKLSDSLKNTLSKIKNSITVDRQLVAEVVKEIQKALLLADVNVKLVLELTKNIQKRAIEENNKELSKKDHLITIIYEELSKFLGFGSEFEIKEKQNRIMLVGLYGQGKTTTTTKLGNYFKQRSKKVALISTDTYRPAAFEQLKQAAQKAEIAVFGDPSEKNPNKIYSKFEKELSKYDIVIIDSAGRDFLNEELVSEIKDLSDLVNPTDTFLVLGADVGQTAQKQAQMFKEQLEISGVVITKMDGTGKGGGALSACAIVQAPVKFIGIGEKIDDLERFNSEKFVSQILGMGDIESLLEKAKLAINEDEATDIAEKMMSGKFDLDDMVSQMKTMKKMGSISKIASFIPGLGGLSLPKDELKKQEEQMKKWEIIMTSMTKYERKNPDNIDISRIKRISTGSGHSITDTRNLLKQFKQMKKMMGMLKNPTDLPDMENMNPQEMMKFMKKSGMSNMMKKR